MSIPHIYKILLKAILYFKLENYAKHLTFTRRAWYGFVAYSGGPVVYSVRCAFGIPISCTANSEITQIRDIGDEISIGK